MTTKSGSARPPRKRTPRAAEQTTLTRKAAPIPRILTIGHSTHPIDEFIALLQAHEVTRLVDVRTVPRSRHNPQFNRDQLPASLNAAGISYLHLPSLGGLRRTSAESVNTGWRNTSFRGYADYMQTAEFRSAVDQLIELAEHDRLALMCAEAVPWRCHRSLVADALLVRGIQTEDIRSATQLMPHRLTPFASVRGTEITYPPQNSVSPAGATKRRQKPIRILKP